MSDLLDKNHHSPMDVPYSKTGKSREQKDQDALFKAMEDDRKNISDPAQVRTQVLEAKVAQLEAFMQSLVGLHGNFPIKVDGDIISIDPSIATKLQNLATVKRNVCVNGAPGVERIYGFPATPL